MIGRFAASSVLVVAAWAMTAAPAGAEPACGGVVTESVTLTADRRLRLRGRHTTPSTSLAVSTTSP